MQNLSYHVILEREEQGTYSVYVPALPGCYSQGDTVEEALQNAREAIECHIESLLKDGLPIPNPSDEIVREVRIAV